MQLQASLLCLQIDIDSLSPPSQPSVDSHCETDLSTNFILRKECNSNLVLFTVTGRCEIVNKIRVFNTVIPVVLCLFVVHLSDH